MKKCISLLLCFCLCFAVFAGCKKGNTGGDDMTIIGGGGDGDGEGITPEPGITYAVAQKHAPLENYKVSFDIIGGGNVMPIGGWAGPFEPRGMTYNGHVQPNFLDDKYWELFKDCGINMINFTRDEWRATNSSVRRALNQAEKYKMAYFVRDTEFAWLTADTLDTMPDVLSEYINHPACAGIYGGDEPRADAFALHGLKSNKFSSLGYDNKYYYVNMLPSYAGNLGGTLPNMPYEQFLRKFLDEIDTKFLSYDYYPFLSADETDVNFSRYFQNLALVRKLAYEYEKPFWAFLQAGGQWDNESGGLHQTTYPLFPSEAATLWNINTMLAYGVKGLQIFDLIQDPILPEVNIAAEPNGGRNYERFGLIGGVGNINRWYYYVQKATKQIQAIDNYLMNSASAGIFAVGENAANLGDGEEIIQDKKYRELQNVTADSAIVGCFDYDGTTAFYIASNTLTSKQKVVLEFDKGYGYDITQRGKTVAVAGSKITLTLEAGEGIFLKLRTE